MLRLPFRPGEICDSERADRFFLQQRSRRCGFDLCFSNRTAFVTTLANWISRPTPLSRMMASGIIWRWWHEDKKEFRFYVDGVLADARAYANTVLFTEQTRFSIWRGKHRRSQYVGLLDRLRYSKGALNRG